MHQKRRRKNTNNNLNEITPLKNNIKKSKISVESIDQSLISLTDSIFTELNASGRQKRAARMKVSNYKPIPLNVKMRRDF